MRTILRKGAMRLDQLSVDQSATVVEVEDHSAGTDVISRRLRELGFVPGEPVRLLTRGPFGAEPILVQIGYTRFALRGSEAARVQVDAGVDRT
jgi:ferrous iron transport protein A